MKGQQGNRKEEDYDIASQEIQCIGIAVQCHVHDEQWNANKESAHS